MPDNRAKYPRVIKITLGTAVVQGRSVTLIRVFDSDQKLDANVTMWGNRMSQGAAMLTKEVG